MSDLQTKIIQRVSEIIKVWCSDDFEGNFGLGWSGGKDSTVVLQLTLQAIKLLPLEKRNKRHLYVVMSNTMMENPILDDYAHEQVLLVKDYVKKEGLPVSVEMVSRENKNSFFYLVLGKGYPLPSNGSTRWCTHKLKIEPVNKYLKDKNIGLMLIGSRRDESARRNRVIKKYEIDEKFSQSKHNLSKVYMVVRDFVIEDIWEVLSHKLLWGDSRKIRNLYKDATGECGVNNPVGASTKNNNSCSARFGCWTCPPITKDKSTEQMSTIHEWLEPLTEFRKYMVEGDKNTLNRSGYTRNSICSGFGKGCYTLNYRKELLLKLLETQKDCNTIRYFLNLEKIELISNNEIEQIKKQWKEDNEKRPFLNDSNEFKNGDFEAGTNTREIHLNYLSACKTYKKEPTEENRLSVEKYKELRQQSKRKVGVENGVSDLR